ncbi:glycosyltransferase family 2 protein [Dokdonia sinensis]|uniref:Glycosyltransferase family 2 protein n=2 Tax=Dokdonia sinensis TaxID=2479847 RepID=A0A3M0GT15_9FLAO|nr:glycosyltransferase family 2 protein [Dokdonia sinensis]
MYRDNLRFLEAMFPHVDYRDFNILVINQTDEVRQLQSNLPNIRVINTKERGLPQSRNMAIKNAKGDICLVADDDVRYVEDVEDIVVSAFAKASLRDSQPSGERSAKAKLASPSETNHPTVITFQMVKESGVLYQDYPDIRKHTNKSISTVNGVVIAFNRKLLLEQHILYNNHFGLGATFGTANEYVFMRNVLKAGAVALFEPKVILSHPDVSSGRFQGEDRVIYGRAALKYKEYGVFAYLWILKYLRFLVAHKYIEPEQFREKLKVGFSGIKKYKQLLKDGLETR